jgi:uncharacterized small protein (DUF1192 family)
MNTTETASPADVAEAMRDLAHRAAEDEIGLLVRNVIRPLEKRVHDLQAEVARLRQGR